MVIIIFYRTVPTKHGNYALGIQTCLQNLFSKYFCKNDSKDISNIIKYISAFSKKVGNASLFVFVTTFWSIVFHTC